MSVPSEHREAEGHLPTSSCLPPWRVFRPNVPTRLQPSFVLNRFRTRLYGSSAHGVYPDQVGASRPWIFLSPFNFQLSTVNSLANHRPAPNLFGWPSNALAPYVHSGTVFRHAAPENGMVMTAYQAQRTRHSRNQHSRNQQSRSPENTWN